jgi:hypothetical protein
MAIVLKIALEFLGSHGHLCAIGELYNGGKVLPRFFRKADDYTTRAVDKRVDWVILQ